MGQKAEDVSLSQRRCSQSGISLELAGGGDSYVDEQQQEPFG